MINLSPCKKSCAMSLDGSYCLSCLRTLEEISNWEEFSLYEKKKIIESLTFRKGKF